MARGLIAIRQRMAQNDKVRVPADDNTNGSPMIERLKLWFSVALALAMSARFALADVASPSQAERLFATKVLPLLKARCLACHGGDPKKIEGELDLTSRDGLLKGGASGKPTVVPGNPAESPLYIAVTRQNPELVMPPKENDRLSAEEVLVIKQWIGGGAPWPPADRIARLASAAEWVAKDGVTVTTSGGLSPEWTSRMYKLENLWAYQPLKKPPVPVLEGMSAANPIDAFIAARLKAMDISPAPPADRRTLIRRVTFDLVGLPPSPKEIDAFLSDPDPDERAFARVIDRLLASPHYGEQWGRHWLDVVRYADSAGLANDFERGNAWRYRDYVVRAFNEDKPHDQFIREQLAGDEIDPENPELLVAVGFLRMGPWELTGMEVAKIARQRYLDDVTETIGQVFLAHPLQCARCHDHKFDPVPTRDYYRIQSALATTQLAERPAAFLPAENTAGFDERKYLDARKERFDAVLKKIDAKEEAAAQKWSVERGLDYVSRRQGLRQGVPEEKLPPARIGLDRRDLGMERIARKGLERLKWELERYEPIALSVYSGRTPDVKSIVAPARMPPDRLTAGELEETCILAGGDPFSPKEPVAPGVLSVSLSASDPQQRTVEASLPTEIEGRRRALADWIANPENPLTARVVVNRIWQGHFGRGIAGNPNNFGTTGKKPTHPELLDWLACEFIERGWSIKALHKLVLTSEAYRRSSLHPDPQPLAAKDASGVSYAAFRPRRLAAEELRDAMLFVSGELNPALGGIPVRPELNLEVAFQPRQVMGTFAAAWQPSPRPQDRHRRSIYTLKLRGLRDPFFEVFNQPSPDSSCECRDEATVTPQAFTLMSSPQSAGRALALAKRVLIESATREQAIERAFRLALGRLPTDAERAACLAHWGQMTERHRTLRFEIPMRPTEIIREAVEENTGEKFTFSEVLEGAADFVPDPHPADVDPDVRGLMEVCLVLLNSNEFLFVD
jgi:mono/diheme cytochrome c family protein